MNERDLLTRLAVRYSTEAMGARRYVYAEHVPTSPGGWAGQRIADAIVLDTYSTKKDEVQAAGGTYRFGKTQSVHGFEIKVSRADWLSELADPSKAEAWAQHCHYFWLVVSDRSIVRDDLPEGWGLLVVSGDGLRAVRKPTRREPVPMPLNTVVALGRAIQKTHMEKAA